MISARKPIHLDATSMLTYSHANTPLGQSERAYYLSYFIKTDIGSFLLRIKVKTGSRRSAGRLEREGLELVSALATTQSNHDRLSTSWSINSFVYIFFLLLI